MTRPKRPAVSPRSTSSCRVTAVDDKAAADDDCRRRRSAEPPGGYADCGAGNKYLSGAQPEHIAPHAPEALQRQFKPDREQQENDAEFSKLAHSFGIADGAQPRRTNQQPCAEIANYRADTQALDCQHDDDRRRQQHQNVDQGLRIMHVRKIALLSPPADTAGRGPNVSEHRAIPEITPACGKF